MDQKKLQNLINQIPLLEKQEKELNSILLDFVQEYNKLNSKNNKIRLYLGAKNNLIIKKIIAQKMNKNKKIVYTQTKNLSTKYALNNLIKYTREKQNYPLANDLTLIKKMLQSRKYLKFYINRLKELDCLIQKT